MFNHVPLILLFSFSIRLAICSEHTEDELTEAASIIRDIVSDNFPILS